MNSLIYKKLLKSILIFSSVYCPLSTSIAARHNNIFKTTKYKNIDSDISDIKKEDKTIKSKHNKIKNINFISKKFYFNEKIPFKKSLSLLKYTHKKLKLKFKSNLSHQLQIAERNIDKNFNLSENKSSSQLNFHMKTSKKIAQITYRGALDAHFIYNLKNKHMDLNLQWTW